MLIFSDENQEWERQYYYALFMIKTNFPDQQYQIQIIPSSTHDAFIEKFNITKFPTLIIINKNEERLRIESTQTWKDIYDKMEIYFNKK